MSADECTHDAPDPDGCCWCENDALRARNAALVPEIVAWLRAPEQRHGFDEAEVIAAAIEKRFGAP